MKKVNNILVIAEVGQAHDGSLGIAHSYIDALAQTGVDAVKFQTHIAEAESSALEQFRVNFSFQDKTRYDYWKRMEFTLEQWAELKTHCEEKGMEFISSPFSVAAVNLLKHLNVKRYKIGSGEISNYLMLDAIAKTNKPIILSSGMSSWDELDATFEFLGNYANPISLLQCTTAYPTSPDMWNLPAILKMKERYQVPVGFSDHSGDIIAPLAAASLGAEIIEFHAVFNKNMFGPDAKSSLEILEIKKLVSGIRDIEKGLIESEVKNDSSSFDQLKIMFGKSLCINKSLKSGDTVTIEDLESKKPAQCGIAAKDYKLVIGKKLKRDMDKWDFININDLQ